MSQERDSAYVAELTDCGSLTDLRALLERFKAIAVDGHAVVIKMSEMDFKEFRRGLRSERKGRFAGEPWMKRFGAVLIPMPMMRIRQIADKYGVPFDVAYRRLQEVRPDLLEVEAGR